MARRQIRLDQIGGYFDRQIQLLVKATAFEAEGRLKKATPVDTGTLRNAWQTRTDDPYVAEVTNNMDYAEAVCYGTNLPPSWKGKYRSRQNPATVPGFPDLIAKELESWAKKEYKKIVGST